MGLEAHTAAALTRELAKRTGERILTRLEDAGKELTAKDRREIANAIFRLGTLSMKERSPEEEVLFRSYRTALASYEYVTADIVVEAVKDALKAVLEEAAALAPILLKILVRGIGL